MWAICNVSSANKRDTNGRGTNVRKALAISVAAGALLGFAAGPASAQWVLTSTNGGDGHLGTPDPGYQYLIVGSNNGVGQSLTSLVDTATMAETVSFNWSYTTYDCCGSYWDTGGYMLDGIYTQLTPAVGPYADVGATYTGRLTLALSPGDTYGFAINSVDSIEGPGTIEFASVPEASTWAMLLAGFGMLGFVGMRRRAGALATPSS